MKIKIIDAFPTVEIYIDGQKVNGVVKYKIVRCVGELPSVVLTLTPHMLDLNLSDSIIKKRHLIIPAQFKYEVKKFFYQLREKRMLPYKKREHKGVNKAAERTNMKHKKKKTLQVAIDELQAEFKKPHTEEEYNQMLKKFKRMLALDAIRYCIPHILVFLFSITVLIMQLLKL